MAGPSVCIGMRYAGYLTGRIQMTTSIVDELEFVRQNALSIKSVIVSTDGSGGRRYTMEEHDLALLIHLAVIEFENRNHSVST